MNIKAKLEKCAPNFLDVVSELTPSQLFSVTFYANEKDKNNALHTVLIQIQKDFNKEWIALAVSSACIPVTYWKESAAAYARAAEFISLSKLKDYRTIPKTRPPGVPDTRRADGQD